MEKIPEVNSVTVHTQSDSSVTISAEGTVNSFGWENPELKLVGRSNGELRFFFEAEKGNGLPGPVPIQAPTISVDRVGIHKVTVNAQTNSISKDI